MYREWVRLPQILRTDRSGYLRIKLLWKVLKIFRYAKFFHFYFQCMSDRRWSEEKV